MQANDVMTRNIISVRPEADVSVIARLLVNHGISAVPVIAEDNSILGIVSEGDLMRRPENETERQPSWWLQFVSAPADSAANYIKTHGRKAADVMSRNVITVSEDTPIQEIAHLLEKHRIKRVPVTRNDKLVGIVSRANLLQGLASQMPSADETDTPDDQAIRKELIRTLDKEISMNTSLINVIVRGGAVHLWGLVDSTEEIEAARIAAENTPGVNAVENNLTLYPAGRMGV